MGEDAISGRDGEARVAVEESIFGLTAGTENLHAPRLDARRKGPTLTNRGWGARKVKSEGPEAEAPASYRGC